MPAGWSYSQPLGVAAGGSASQPPPGVEAGADSQPLTTVAGVPASQPPLVLAAGGCSHPGVEAWAGGLSHPPGVDAWSAEGLRQYCVALAVWLEGGLRTLHGEQARPPRLVQESGPAIVPGHLHKGAAQDSNAEGRRHTCPAQMNFYYSFLENTGVHLSGGGRAPPAVICSWGGCAAPAIICSWTCSAWVPGRIPARRLGARMTRRHAGM